MRAVRAVSRLEMESVRLFDQPPVTPIDLYHRKLRGQPALIRQVASQTNDDARSVEAQTDEVGARVASFDRRKKQWCLRVWLSQSPFPYAAAVPVNCRVRRFERQ